MEKVKCRYIFWGMGKYGQLAIEKYRELHLKEENILGVYDSKKQGEYCGYPIIKIDESEYKQEILIITVDNSWLISEIYNKAKKLGYKNIFWFTGIKQGTRGDFLEDFCVDCSSWGELVLPQAEIHVVDFCNLNCKGCAHFSPIFEKKMPGTQSRIYDIEMLKSKITHIIKFYLLGGEPFLNPEIITYIEKSRQILPNTMIQIVTNGLLIPSLKPEVFDAIRENNIIISISEYEPTHTIIGKIEEILTKNNISYVIRPYDSKKKFIKPLSLSENSMYEKKCISDGCINIYNGMIARCPTLMYIDEFNKVFNTELPNQGIYSLSEVSGEQILKFMQQKVQLCEHCIDNVIEWSRCERIPVIEDFAERD